MSYIDDLWWVMHRSDDPNKQALVVTCYLDDSGTDDLSPYTVVAGLLLNKYNLKLFEDIWPALLKDHNVKPILHMKDFANPKLPYKWWDYEKKYALFADVVAIINKLKIHSVAATINQSQFNTIMNQDIKETMGIYAMCYMACVFTTHKMAEHSKYYDNIAFILDLGTRNTDHVIRAHRGLVNIQKKTPSLIGNIGTIAFEDDERVVALQAADIIAWGVRRRLAGLPFRMGYEPIPLLLTEDDHLQYPWESKDFQEIKEHIENLSPSDFNEDDPE
ncbi:MAG: DUF3800 domain-containing protein [Desulfobaccales bacterium]